MTPDAQEPPAVVARHVRHLEPADGDKRDDRLVDDGQRVVQIRRRRDEELRQLIQHAPVVR